VGSTCQKRTKIKIKKNWEKNRKNGEKMKRKMEKWGKNEKKSEKMVKKWKEKWKNEEKTKKKSEKMKLFAKKIAKQWKRFVVWKAIILLCEKEDERDQSF